MNSEATDRFCERGILALVLAILVFAPLATAAVRTQELIIILTLVAGIMVLWGIRLWVQESPKLLFPPICWAVLAFTGYAICRYFTCDIEYIGRLELLRVLIYAFLFFAIINNLHRQSSMQVICFTLIFLAMTLGIVAAVQWLTKVDKVPSLSALLEWWLLPQKTWYFPRAYIDRASGTYINPNHLAGFLEMLIPLAIAYTVVGRSKPLVKVFLGYAALVMIAALGMTISRGSWVATGITLFILFGVLATFSAYQRPALVLMGIIAVGSTFFIMRTEYFKERFRAAFKDGRVEWDMREMLWQSTTRMWKDHRWTGVGPGHFDYRFRQYRPPEVQLRPDRAHNEYLNLLADWGVVGAGIVASGLVIFFVGVLRTWRFVYRGEQEFKTNFSNKFAVVLGGTMGIVALLGHSMTDFNLQIPANAILAVTLMAIVSSHLRFATDKYWVGLSRAVKPLLTVLLLAVTALFLHQFLRLGREYLWLERAELKQPYSDEMIHTLSNAWRVEPKNFETCYGIGKSYCVQSSEGDENYGELATNGMVWLARGMEANPHDERNFVEMGWALDWVKRFDESEPLFWRAEELDPNGYFTLIKIARHYRYVGDFAAARTWAERSLKLKANPEVNTDAATERYLAHRELLRNALEADTFP